MGLWKKRGRALGKSAMGLALAGLLALTGCASEKAVIYETEVLPENDGAPARLSLYAGELYDRPACREALEEIIARYQADYPHTEIELLDAGQDSGESADIVPVEWGQQMSGLLDFSEYLDAWENEGSLTSAARVAMHSRGGEGVYAVPLDLTQPMVFYREDWMEAYNEGIAWRDQARVEKWEELLAVPGKLGEQGALVIEEDCWTTVLESAIWSTVGIQEVADYSLGFYTGSEQDGPGTVFTTENGQKGLELFHSILSTAKELPGGESQAVQEFIDGKAGVLIAENTVADRLTREMSGGWQTGGLPVGESGVAAFSCRWTGLGVRGDTEEPEKAVHFLAYLTNVDNNTHLAKVCGFLPIYKESADMEPALGEGVRAGEMALLAKGGYCCLGTYNLTDQKDNYFLMEDACNRLRQGEVSDGELLAQLDKAYMDILNQYLGQGNPLPWAEEE